MQMLSFGFGQVQNCVGSSCNQNNFGRKRRQILEEILAEVEAEEDFATVVKRQAEEQNCQGSDCNQNNLGGAVPIAPEPVPAPPPAPVPVPVPAPSTVQVPVPVPSPVEIPIPVPVPSPVQVPIQVPVPVPSPVEIPVPVISQVPVQVPVPVLAPSPVEIPVPVLSQVQVPVPAPVPGPFPFPAGFPFTGLGASLGGAGGAQVQNCEGSTCNQNNVGRKKRQIAEAIHALAVDVLEAEDEAVTDDVVEPISKAKRQVQNCVGSSCNQNNFGRKKRQIAEAIDALTTEVLEDEAISKAKRDADAQSQNCFGSSCNQNNFGRRKREVIAALLQELL